MLQRNAVELTGVQEFGRMDVVFRSVVADLKAEGIGSGMYYTTPLHLQPALAELGYGRGSLPVTEQLAQDNFSVPLWAGIGTAEQERVVSVVQAAAPVAS